MACFRPVEAWQPLDGGQLRFREVRGARPINVPCGVCIGCRMTRVRGWALRCLHEAQMHPEPSSFVTLTYDDEHYSPSLNYSDFQKFKRRMRDYYGSPTRFFVAGEYGQQTNRPHFHALLFGRPFHGGRSVGKNIHDNPVLSKLWPYGFSSVGEVTFQSAAYVASYTLKMAVARNSVYFNVDPDTGESRVVARPFAHMSRNPGLGYTWFQKYWREVYEARDGVCVQGGHVFKAPRYYDKLLADTAPDLRSYKDLERYLNSARFVEDSSPQRLLTREICALAAQKMKGRGL